jgi:hypothetical protein
MFVDTVMTNYENRINVIMCTNLNPPRSESDLMIQTFISSCIVSLSYEIHRAVHGHHPIISVFSERLLCAFNARLYMAPDSYSYLTVSSVSRCPKTRNAYSFEIQFSGSSFQTS